jgi:hypothetical protein
MESLDLAVPSGLTTKMAEIESWFTSMSLELTSQRFAVHGQCAGVDSAWEQKTRGHAYAKGLMRRIPSSLNISSWCSCRILC